MTVVESYLLSPLTTKESLIIVSGLFIMLASADKETQGSNWENPIRVFSFLVSLICSLFLSVQ